MIKPVDFRGTNVQVAKDQDEYLTFPGIFVGDPEGTLITQWQFDKEDIDKMLANDGKVYLSILTFNHPIQPLKFFHDLSDDIELI